MLAISNTRAATSLPALARSLRKLHKSGGSRTVVTRASSADTKQEQQSSEGAVQQQQQQAPAPLRRQQRRRGLWPNTMGGLGTGGLLSPLVPTLAGPLSPLADIDYELNRVLNELQSMQDVVFGHRDTVGRIPDKLDFNCDILEKKGEFLITADLPGLSKEHGEPEEDVKLHVYERVYGKIERMFRLPDNANDKTIEASMKNGVLTVHVPKHPPAEDEEKKEPHERQIKIK